MSKRLPLHNFVLQPAENQCAPFGTKAIQWVKVSKAATTILIILSVSFLFFFLAPFGCRCHNFWLPLCGCRFLIFWLLLSHLLVAAVWFSLSHLLVVAFTSFWLPPILQMWTMYYCRVRLLDKTLHLCDWKKEIRRPSIFVLKLVGTNSFNRFLFFGNNILFSL